MKRAPGMRSLLFEIQEVQEKEQDVWVIYQSESALEHTQSLYNLLWQIEFDAGKVVKKYQIQHSTFYNIILRGNGKKQLGNLILKICTLLRNIADIGAMYGNLRTENILINLSPDKKEIKNVKFLHFGHLTKIEDAEHILIPDQIDHLPPDMSSYLLQIKRFQQENFDAVNDEQKTDLQTSNSDTVVNVKFLQSAASADCFGLGMILLQIATGYPSQMELPLTVKLQTVKGNFVIVSPHFGHCLNSTPTDKYASQTIKLQGRLLNNLKFFLKKNKSMDQYGLLADP